MTGAERAAEDAVARQVDGFLTDGLEGVRRGLADLGWSPGAGIADSVIDTVWTNPASGGRVRAHTGEGADGFFVGLIANVTDDRAAQRLRDRMAARIADPLRVPHLRPGPTDERSMTWADEQLSVELSLLLEIRQDTHTLPAAVQFAMQPLRNVTPVNRVRPAID
ncbi:hypothetical protein [Nakamurella sp.]|uniref:hypothetical protein n=1 Tax=Nakamurella sp. TaxID=1869182 RepID=UPI003784DA9F